VTAPAARVELVEARADAPRGGAVGFTLLEVMVALAILAGALLALSDVVTSALRNHVRARELEVATLLARGKLAALEDHFEAKGFETSDQTDEGTFEEEGHPEIRWRVEVVQPPGALGPEEVLRALTGSEQGLEELLPPADQVPPALAPLQAQLAVAMQGVLTRLGEQLKRGVRELRLTVSWPEGAGEESFTVTTHLVVLAPGAGTLPLP
jgi:general secretion pathway protein I